MSALDEFLLCSWKEGIACSAQHPRRLRTEMSFFFFQKMQANYLDPWTAGGDVPLEVKKRTGKCMKIRSRKTQYLFA